MFTDENGIPKTVTIVGKEFTEHEVYLYLLDAGLFEDKESLKKGLKNDNN